MFAKKLISLLVLSVVPLLISSCSWHLRGYTPSASTETATTTSGFSLTATDIYTPMYRVLKNTYEHRGINLSPADNQLQLKLLGENTRSRILSLNTELDPAESELTYVLHYQITLPGQLPQAHNIHLYRTYIQNKDYISARDNEKEKLVSEMRLEAAEKILNQMKTLAARQH